MAATPPQGNCSECGLPTLSSTSAGKGLGILTGNFLTVSRYGRNLSQAGGFRPDFKSGFQIFTSLCKWSSIMGKPEARRIHMGYEVFVSHSMRQEDLGIVYAAARDARARDINCYIAERDWQFGHSLPEKIKAHIRTCDCFVAFLTLGGSHSEWVNQEIGCAVGLRRHRILVVERGVEIKGFDIGKEYVVLDRINPSKAIATLNTYLSTLKDVKEKQQIAALFVLGVLTLIALFGGRK
jgi:hypothetical protein